MRLLIAFCLLATVLCCQAKMKVATLSPLLADLAKQVGGEHVAVVDLMGTNADPHAFRPSPSALSKAQGASIYLAMGKGMEPYLPKLQSITKGKASILEVGKKVPSLLVSGDSAIYACCPKHSVGSLDPHWWQSLENWRRATTIVEKEFAAKDPANASYYKTRSKQYRKQLASTKSWAKKQIATIPRSNRTLTTAHAAFGYFCKEFGFKSIPVQGLNKEQSASPKYIQEAIATVKKHNVRAIFPEKGANSKGLRTIAKSTGAKIGPELYADSAPSIIGMFQKNVTNITQALK